MPNQNETMCGCMAIYNATTGGCDDPQGQDPCPEGSNGGNGFWQTAGSWDWNAINQNAMQWLYAFGVIKPPASSLSSDVYMMELQKQRQQTNMIMIGLGVLMLVIVILILRKKK